MTLNKRKGPNFENASNQFSFATSDLVILAINYFDIIRQSQIEAMKRLQEALKRIKSGKA
jgi:preprotein translocase subunit YajC